MKLTVLVSLFILLIQTLCAQSPDSLKNKKDDLTNNIGISIGITDFHMKDELAAPLTYRGVGIASNIQYNKNGEGYKHFIELTFNYDKLKSNYDEYYTPNIAGSLRYDYLHRILNIGSKNEYSFYVGGGVYSYINYSVYMESVDQNYETNVLAYTWYIAHSAEVTLLFEYVKTPINRFTLQLYIPIFLNVSRPAYSLFISTSSDVSPIKMFGDNSFFWQNPLFQFKITYERKINRWCCLFANYDFQYSSYDKPRTVSMYMNNFLMGINFLF